MSSQGTSLALLSLPSLGFSLPSTLFLGGPNSGSLGYPGGLYYPVAMSLNHNESL